jgi:hypothetical protein
MNLFNVNYSYVQAVVVVVVPELAAFVMDTTKYRKISVMSEISWTDIEKIHTNGNRNRCITGNGNEYFYSRLSNTNYNCNDFNRGCKRVSFALKKRNK